MRLQLYTSRLLRIYPVTVANVSSGDSSARDHLVLLVYCHATATFSYLAPEVDLPD